MEKSRFLVAPPTRGNIALGRSAALLGMTTFLGVSDGLKLRGGENALLVFGMTAKDVLNRMQSSVDVVQQMVESLS